MTCRHEAASAEGLAHPTAIEEALAAFRRDYPAFEGTSVLDDLRVRDYARLDAAGHIYLDYTGGGLYGESQLTRHHELLANSLFGNPHSQNQPSQDMSDRVAAARRQILEFFRASSDEYEVIFTPNATGALRLVGESVPFRAAARGTC